MKRALLSVSDKTGLVEFAGALAARGVELIATGGTATTLRDAELDVTEVADLTGFPEMLGGRVKTLHPAIHGALLARREVAEDMAQLDEHGISAIDLVVVNLYPFRETVADATKSAGEIIEQIDIGGVALLRAAAKNHASVAVVSSPQDYESVLDEWEEHGGLSIATRRDLAARAFYVTASYDAAIASWTYDRANAMARGEEGASGEHPSPPANAPAQRADGTDARFPGVLNVLAPRRMTLRYGENPHQNAAFYVDPDCHETSLARAEQLAGKPLSYNNLLDAEGALEMARDFAPLAPAAAVIVKHANPCGIAIAATPAEAYERARATDPDSAFGGIIAMSSRVDLATAEQIVDTFNEVVIAPSFSEDALDLLARKKKNLRLLATGEFTPRKPGTQIRSIVGGYLVMDRDLTLSTGRDLRVATAAQPTGEDLDALIFAWRCAKWVKSNAIVYTDARSTIGIGAGQMSRVDAARFGALKARRSLQGAYLASDAFFPFRDGVDAAAEQGIKAIIQPGGSVRDDEVIEACNEHGIAMVFTGHRHFRH